jgi:Winged helix DNA-binding domain
VRCRVSRTSERTLSTRDLNRALLARQQLLVRRRLTLPQALGRMGGLQAQYAPSMYIGLWSRGALAEREQLTRALVRRTVVQGTLLRSTIHLVRARDYWPFAIAVRSARREHWLRNRPALTAEGHAAAAAKARELLADGPMTRAELVDAIGKELFPGLSLWLDLVRVPPSGTWERRRADLYGLAEEWVGPASELGEEEAVAWLAGRYLAAFGPASSGDVASWAGLAVSEVSAALERLRLRRFHDEEGGVLVDLPRAPLPGGDVAAPVRFLPTWDATLLVHARRTAILPERFRPRIFNATNPQSLPTVLVDGAVAGTWADRDGRVKLDLFEPLPKRVRRELEDEAARLARFLA